MTYELFPTVTMKILLMAVIFMIFLLGIVVYHIVVYHISVHKKKDIPRISQNEKIIVISIFVGILVILIKTVMNGGKNNGIIKLTDEMIKTSLRGTLIEGTLMASIGLILFGAMFIIGFIFIRKEKKKDKIMAKISYFVMFGFLSGMFAIRLYKNINELRTDEDFYITVESISEKKSVDRYRGTSYYCYIQGYNEKLNVSQRIYKDLTEGEEVY